MHWGYIIALIVFGLLFLVLEILVVPGASVFGILGAVFIGVGIWQAYAVYGNLAGHLTVLSCILLSVVVIYISIRTKTWKKLMLETQINSKVNEIDTEKIIVGEKGVTLGRLAPMGKARINNEIVEVSSFGPLIDENTEIVIISVKGNRILVKEV